MINTSTIVGQMRLLTGDFDNGSDDLYLTDAVYMFLYNQANSSIRDGAIQALESIIANISLRPTSLTNGDSNESYAGAVIQLNKRLERLKLERDRTVTPILIKSDRSNWDDFNKIWD